jgi:hypothetical protein
VTEEAPFKSQLLGIQQLLLLRPEPPHHSPQFRGPPVHAAPAWRAAAAHLAEVLSAAVAGCVLGVHQALPGVTAQLLHPPAGQTDQPVALPLHRGSLSPRAEAPAAKEFQGRRGGVGLAGGVLKEGTVGAPAVQLGQVHHRVRTRLARQMQALHAQKRCSSGSCLAGQESGTNRDMAS